MPVRTGIGSLSGDQPEGRLSRDRVEIKPATLKMEKASLSDIHSELAKARVLEAARLSMIDAGVADSVSFSLSFDLSW